MIDHNDEYSNALHNLGDPSFINNINGVDPDALISLSVSDPFYGTAEAIQHQSINDPDEQWADIFANYVAGNIDLSDPTDPGIAMYNFAAGVLMPGITH